MRRSPESDVRTLTPAREIVMDPLEALRTLLVVQERVISERLSSLMLAAEGRAAAERALGGIVLDTLGEKEELEDLVIQWSGGMTAAMAPGGAGRTEFRDLVASLLEVKRTSARRYRRAAESAPSDAIRDRLVKLGRQAGEHAAILLGILGDLDSLESADEAPQRDPGANRGRA